MKNEYINIKAIAQAKGLKSTRSIRMEINKPESKYISREVKVNGGTSYEILFSSLEPELQQKLRENETKSTALVPLNYKPPVITDKARITANHRMNIVKAALEHRKKYDTQKQADHEFLELYNTGLFLQKAYEFLGSISMGTLRRYIQAYLKSGNAESLVPQYKITKQGEYNGILNNDMKKVLLALLLHQNRFGFNTAIRLAKQILIKQGYDEESLPSDITFKRYAEHFRDNNYAEWVLKREGIKAYHDKVEPYIERDISKIEVGDVLIADGHVLNFQVINPFTGKPTRATLVGFLDWKSTALVGYEIMLEENTQCIASALRNAIINLDMIPKIVYQDNGRAFRAKYFTCGSGSVGSKRKRGVFVGEPNSFSNDKGFTELGFQGLYSKLGIETVFARPYNARAKVIERFFRELQDGFERLMPSFVGANIVDKPAYLNRNEDFHKNVHNDFIPTIEQLSKMLDYYMDYHRSLECPNVKGKTIGEVFESGKGSGIELEKLDDLMMSKEIKTINRNGIRFLNADYYNDCLYGLKERVQIKYSLLNLTKIKVYTLNNEFICYADRVMPIHPIATYLGDIKDKEELNQKLKQQKSLEKQTVKNIRKYLKSEHIKPLEWQNEPTKAIEFKTNKIFSNKQEEKVAEDISDKKFMTRYERYEWHLKNGFSNDKEVAWFKEYETTKEFKEIFGKEENEAEICKN